MTSFTVMVFFALGGRAMLPGTIYSSNWNWLKICRWLELTGS